MPALLSDTSTIDVDPPDNGGDDDNRGEPVRWIKVATFWTPPQAQLARIKLESEDVDCQLADENIIAADYLLAPAVGGIKVLVPEDQVERARTLLSVPVIATMQPGDFATCPECGSLNIYRPLLQAKTFWAGIVALLLLGSVVLAPFGLAGFVYYVIMWRPWRCRDCSDVFRRETGPQGFPIGVNLKRSPAAEK